MGFNSTPENPQPPVPVVLRDAAAAAIPAMTAPALRVAPTHRPLSSSLLGLSLESYKGIPKRNYLGAHG